MHEIAHTLLNLWGQPNYDNEETADEFAIALMLMEKDERKRNSYFYGWINWFKENNSFEDEVSAMRLGGRQHPLTVQRIAFIEEALLNRETLSKRWSSVIYPHLTSKKLLDIIENPYWGANVVLAREILVHRD